MIAPMTGKRAVIAGRGRRPARAESEGQHDVLHHREGGKQIELLKDVPDRLSSNGGETAHVERRKIDTVD